MHFEILIIKLKTLIEMKVNISYSLAWLEKCVDINPHLITEILSYELLTTLQNLLNNNLKESFLTENEVELTETIMAMLS